MPDAKENPIEAGEKKIEGFIKSEPWYVRAGAVAAAGVIVFFVIKRRQSAASTSTAASSQSGSNTDSVNGYQVDSMAGLPYGSEAGGYNYQGGPVDNYPFAEVGVNGNNVPVVPAGMTPIYDSNGTLVGFQEPSPTTSPAPTPTPAPQPAPTPTPTPTPQPASAFTRARGTGNAGYDKSAKGLPVWRNDGTAFPKGTQGLIEDPANGEVIPYSASVQITQPKDAQGTVHILYNGIQGEMHAWDIAGQGGGSIPVEAGGIGGGFHLPINIGRNTVDQWAFSNGMHQGFDSYTAVGE